jgi:hypothetical protein
LARAEHDHLAATPPGGQGIQGYIEATMGAGPLKQSSQPPVPQEHPGTPMIQPPLWARRLLLVIEVAISVWAGMLVIVLPWTRLWTENPLLSGYPDLRYVLNLSFVRGMISGIGLVDIWMGVSDASRYRTLR